jgi:hypothetical protein
MDSHLVNKEIRRIVWPYLQDAGFTRRTSRSAWRYAPSRVEVLNFQSYNSYNAGVLGCTTYSFSVNLGVYLCEVPPSHPANRVKESGGHLVPAEYACHLRRRLQRSFVQPECTQRDIWYIDPAGAYITEALQDVRRVLERDAMPWYSRLRDSAEVLRILLEEPEDMQRIWGFGRNPSPSRSYLTGYIALSLNRPDLARASLQDAAHSGCFTAVSDALQLALERAG